MDVQALFDRVVRQFNVAHARGDLVAANNLFAQVMAFNPFLVEAQVPLNAPLSYQAPFIEGGYRPDHIDDDRDVIIGGEPLEVVYIEGKINFVAVSTTCSYGTVDCDGDRDGGHADACSAWGEYERLRIDGADWSGALAGGNWYRKGRASTFTEAQLQDMAIATGLVPHEGDVDCACNEWRRVNRNAASLIRWERNHNPSLRIDPLRWHATARAQAE